MSALVQIADFGTDYTGIGWLTLIGPLVVLALIVVWWRSAWRRGAGESIAETVTPTRPAKSAKAAKAAGKKKGASR